MRRILIANRGEIAVRIINTAKRMGIEVVSIYHSNEKGTMHAKLADLSIDLGNGELSETYLNIPKIIGIALENACDAIHPGYGFLSENYLFAKACEENSICFIGPSSEVIRQMASKNEAKQIAKRAGIPYLKAIVVDVNFNEDNLDMNFPLLVKALMGGGGKGMKIVNSKDDLKPAIETARREALAYFGDENVLIEPFLENARHIEVQVLGDIHGNIVHLFERECSIQRNHQKIIEEAPASSIPYDLRSELLKAAIKFAKELKYTNAGTIEFLVHNSDFYFLEMNTRIQVEHPVTEAITGIDIVEEQIQIARGNVLPENLKHLEVSGHAIEARIYAENSYDGFIPSTGKIEFLEFPDTIRIDSFIEKGITISPYFDSMLAKIIVSGTNRDEAINRLSESLYKCRLHGIDTNISYLSAILAHKNFLLNAISTDFIKFYHSEICRDIMDKKEAINALFPALAYIYFNFIKTGRPIENLWQMAGATFIGRTFTLLVDEKQVFIRVSRKTDSGYFIESDGQEHFVQYLHEGFGKLEITLKNKLHTVFYTSLPEKKYDVVEIESYIFRLSCQNTLRMTSDFLKKNILSERKHLNQIVSPLFGKVVDIKVKVRDNVKKGDILLTIESMKTENHILSPNDGVVETIHVEKGIQVKENIQLLTLNSVN
jgi:3-methylcrotonyl-CoA carboxylase alpha subunit